MLRLTGHFSRAGPLTWTSIDNTLATSRKAARGAETTSIVLSISIIASESDYSRTCSTTLTRNRAVQHIAYQMP